MSKVFEDEFMDLQAGLISLSLEVAGEEEVDKVFAYCCNEEKCKAFYAFFDIKGEIKMLHQIGVPDKLAFQFMGEGIDDMGRLDSLCKKHNMPIPTELRLQYDVKSGTFNADYKYKKHTRGRRTPGEVYIEWVEKMKQEYASK